MKDTIIEERKKEKRKEALLKTVKQISVYTCGYCGGKFKNTKLLEIHVSNSHSKKL